MMLLEQDLSEFLSKINLDKFLDECESRFPLFSEMAGHSGYDVEDKKSLASFLELLNDIQNVGVAGVSPCGFTYNDEISDFYCFCKMPNLVFFQFLKFFSYFIFGVLNFYPANFEFKVVKTFLK